MAELRPIIVFHGRHFVRHLGICKPIFVKLIQVIVWCHSDQFLKNDVSISNRFPEVHKRCILTHTDRQTHTHTHDDSIRRNAMRWIPPKNSRCCSPVTKAEYLIPSSSALTFQFDISICVCYVQLGDKFNLFDTIYQIVNSGNGKGLTISLGIWLSIVNHHPWSPSGLLINIQAEAKGDWLGLIKPISNNALISSHCPEICGMGCTWPVWCQV